MRPLRLILLVLLASLTSIAGASKRVTVEQLEQTVTAARTAHRPDAEFAARGETRCMIEASTASPASCEGGVVNLYFVEIA